MASTERIAYSKFRYDQGTVDVSPKLVRQIAVVGVLAVVIGTLRNVYVSQEH